MKLKDLEIYYNEPHRHYHNLSHIKYMLKNAKKLKFDLTLDLLLAIWGHDVIYNVGSNNNEALSAIFMKKYFNCSNRVYEAILATIEHIPDQENHISIILNDLDMLILSDTENYSKYIEGVFKEYFPNSRYDRPPQEWLDGRTRWIEETLNKKIFYTKECRHLEKIAKKNLIDEQEYIIEQVT